MSHISKPLLCDIDNLNQAFQDRRNKELLHNSGYKTTKALVQALVSKKSHGAEYVVGLPGTGKTTFAMEQLGAQPIETRNDIINLMNMDFDKAVFVTCDVKEEIASNASHITMMDASPQRIQQQRQNRDDEIMEGDADTAFGRRAGTVAKVTTDSSILLSKLKTDYENKSDIIYYSSEDIGNRNKDHVSMKDISDAVKYAESGVVTASGKRAPAQIVHIEHQLKRVLSLSQEKGLSAFFVIGQNSGGDYDLGLTQHERIKIIDLVFQGQVPFITSGTPKFIKTNDGKIIKIVPALSRAILGKERLPKGFVQGSYDDLLRTYPAFMKHKDAYAVNMFAGYNYINIGDFAMEGSEESISATFIRKCLVEGNIHAIKPYLSPEIFTVLTSPYNLQALQRRYSLIQQRDQALEDAIDAFMREYRQKNPLNGQSLINKKGEPVFLSKRHADACSNRRDQAKIMTYLQNTEKIKKDIERKIKKKYNALIYAPENKLDFDISY